MDLISEIKEIYNNIQDDIKKATEGYKKAFTYNDKDFFAEMCFCLLTPQSKAINAWEAIKTLKKNKLLFNGNNIEISEHLNIVRFKNNKAKYIVELREKMTKNNKLIPKEILQEQKGFEDIVELRNWIAKNIKGMGMKEASHLLRNFGFGKHLAILDRHILKNLKKLEVITDIPKTITVKKYLEIENKMKEFSNKIDIDMESLDLVLWYKEAGEVFK